jgi:hypothetical protein
LLAAVEVEEPDHIKVGVAAVEVGCLEKFLFLREILLM